MDYIDLAYGQNWIEQLKTDHRHTRNDFTLRTVVASHGWRFVDYALWWYEADAADEDTWRERNRQIVNMYRLNEEEYKLIR